MKTSFKANIFVDNSQMKIKVVELKTRVKFILSLLCNFSTEVSIKFCDKIEMQQANSSYRKKNYATDVLSFPNTTLHSEGNYFYLGDILICAPVCLEQAKKAKVTFSQELEKMIIHGIVHLKGLDHDRNSSAWRVMNSLETILQKELVKNLQKPSWCSAVP
ncbi:MAG: rRNA maturation RNase YbeY [Bdellovibrionota bacterium]